jgi:MarR family transcriptional regulator for hemolysin
MLQKDLAAIIGIEGPTLVRILDSLEKRGLVERRQAKNDRRGKTVHVTAEAKPLLNRIEKTAKVLRQEILSNIPAEQLTACLTVLEQIATNLEENSA